MPIQQLNVYQVTCDRCEETTTKLFAEDQDAAVKLLRDLGWVVGVHQEMRTMPPRSHDGVVHDVFQRRLVWCYDKVTCGRCQGMIFAEEQEAKRNAPAE